MTMLNSKADFVYSFSFHVMCTWKHTGHLSSQSCHAKCKVWCKSVIALFGYKKMLKISNALAWRFVNFLFVETFVFAIEPAPVCLVFDPTCIIENVLSNMIG